jgi:hypothetical protein
LCRWTVLVTIPRVCFGRNEKEESSFKKNHRAVGEALATFSMVDRTLFDF